MCGIVGHIAFNGTIEQLPSLDLIAHRGPDGEGEWVNETGTVYLGHTRLAILEPTAAGHQPMHNATRQFTITFNGEIYNHLTLRKQLLPDVKWHGNSDTETLIELFAQKGIEALQYVKGMFAFALYDHVSETLLLIRDRLGIKPLWYKYDKESLSFSSEVRPLLTPDGNLLTTEAISEYAAFGRLPASGEVFENIHSLAPGSWLKIKQNGSMEQGKWWPASAFKTSNPRSRQHCVKRVKELVTSAIEEHLISDVGVGAFLSGGIDSSIVTLVAGKALGKNLQTFTVGFPDSKHDEREVARRVARKFNTDHTELEITEIDCLDWVMEAVARLDSPSVDAINTYIVSKAVHRSDLKVALSGLGGDELFGGYPSFKDVPVLHKLAMFPEPVRQRLIRFMPAKVKAKLEGLQEFSITDLTVNRRRFTSVNKLLELGLKAGKPYIPEAPAHFDMMGKIAWAEIQGYMIPMLLRDSDQMSMAVGLEIRVPFLDHNLVEEVLRYPQIYKNGRGVKPLLVDAFRGELPEEVYGRPKQGFALPMDDWMRGPLAEFTQSGIEAASSQLSLPEPAHQYKLFMQGGVHWTRAWQWCVLGHWLVNERKTEPAEILV